MKDPNRFYTYAYLREDRTPYYIGKGNGDRMYRKGKNDVKPPKDKSRIIFLKQNLTEEEAFTHEIYIIAVFGRKDLGTGILRNKTNGGEGSSGWVASEETRKIMSELKKGVNNGKKWWNDDCGNSKISLDCPGEGWVLGISEETRQKFIIINKGKNKNKKWWNDGNGNNMYIEKCPGEGWVLGLSEKTKLKMGKHTIGTRWWNDGCGNSKRSVECPGPNWFLGQNEEFGKKQSEMRKGKNHPAYGKKWWNDGCGNSKISVECPGEEWVLGKNKEFGKKWWNDGCENSKISVECPGKGWILGCKISKKNYENGIGLASITREERKQIVEKTNSQKWMCLETGYITTSGPLTKYQRAKGIDTSKRVRIL